MLKENRIYGALVCLLISFMLSTSSIASPWVGTMEPQLHQDIQTLSEWGMLDIAATSYPVPWKGIAEQLKSVELDSLPAIPALAVKRLTHYLNIHKRQQGQSIVSLYMANDPSRFTHLNGAQASQVQVNITKEFYTGRWAGQISANYEKGGDKHFDESFIAYQFGNWNVRLGSLSQWWGPGQSSSLILSNNARPVPSIVLSRSQATRSKGKWLKHLGPWFFTAQLGQLEQQRAVPNTKLWMTRLNFKPISGLEMGLSWSAMWGGDGQQDSFKDFTNVLTFQTECINGSTICDDKLDSHIGNHLAGFDLKYTVLAFSRPITIYGQYIGEDAKNTFNITDQANLLGVSSYLWGTKVYIETSDTNVNCNVSSPAVANCYYEHSTYRSGYRRYARAIGSTFDSDAKMLTLGISKSFNNGDMVEVLANRIEFNQDQQSPSPVVRGNSEDLYRLTGFYQTQKGDWLFKLGASFERSKVDKADRTTDSQIYSEIKYHLQ